MTKRAISVDFFDSRTWVTMTPEPQTASGEAHGKVIVVGEHAVVYGSKAVALPVRSMGVSLTLRPHLASSLRKRTKNSQAGFVNQLNDLVADAFRLLELPPFSLSLEGNSSILVGAGLGSSAALCVALLRALSVSIGKELQTEKVAQLARELERKFHGRPSGLDTAVVACEKPLLFAKGKVLKTLKIKGRQEFALIDSGIRSSTLAMIKIAEPFFSAKHKDSVIASFDQLAEQATQGLEKENSGLIAEAMRAAASLLTQAGVVTPPLENIINLAYECGVLAAKPTGAGGGGCILCLLDQDKTDEQLARLVGKFEAHRIFTLTC